MLRRRLFALLLCLLVAGLPLAAEAAHAGMLGGQTCMQHDGSSADCSTDGMANPCALHCAVGSCIVLADLHAAMHFHAAAARPYAREVVPIPGVRTAPDTAPPKAALA